MTSVSLLTVPVLVASVEGQHAVSCARPAEAGHRLTVRMRRNAREDVVDGPGAIPFDAATILSIMGDATRGTALILPDGDREDISSLMAFMTTDFLLSMFRFRGQENIGLPVAPLAIAEGHRVSAGHFIGGQNRLVWGRF